MSILKDEFSDDAKRRINKLENELEEFKVSVSEDNLKLKVPYATDRKGSGIGFEIDGNVLSVYVGDEKAGQISLA